MDSLEWIESSRQQVCSPVRMKRKIRSKRYEFVGWGSRPLIEFLASIGKDISEKISRHDVTSIINDSDETENLSNTFKRDNGITPGRKLNQKTRVLVNPNSYFAAIVPGNINLVYLRKSLVEDLLKDPGTFESKLIGSFVRIKSDPHDYLQKNTHQLVQVIGVKKISISGDLSTKFILHASNVMKDISICMLSDEKFSEEECKDLDLRVKHGLVKRLTVAEFQQKVEVLHVDITKHWLLSEISLLQNLIDQANEKGWRRELDQYLEKKQLLQTAEEQSRILREIPQVIADETELKSIYVSADQGDNVTNEGDETKLQMRGEALDDTNQGDTVPNSSQKIAFYVAENGTAALMSNIKEVAESRQGVLDEEQPPKPVESTYNCNNETEIMNEVEKGCQASERIKESGVINLSDDDEQPRFEEHDWGIKLRSLIWYYLDPQGDVQGPFSLASLKNWKDADYFPSDFKVWKTGQNQDEAVLLSDILSPFFS
ncbi:uncharacterized protein At5g08430 isoform X3 [Momordica charantia]|uniref:Uncharacterized protein At5g08430 isoform X3 n=1 Tax=Momordica charantia TaxID=3673 RepID=A0A6J1D2W8_MOMCH|nr:uncharacterized protein At5g08430 isoform X3 [Momordica charantia]